MENIKEKISKLLNLGKNNSNENEAKSSLLQAQRLMAKYKLTEAEINISVSVEEKVEENATKIKNGMWRKHLIKLLCNNFRCDCFWRKGSTIIVGELSDVELVKELYLFSEQTLLNCFEYYYINESSYDLTKGQLRKSYALGFISGLNQQFEEQKKDIEFKEYAIVMTNQKVTAYMSNMKFKHIYKDKNNDIDLSTYTSGFSKGKNINIHCKGKIGG